MNKEAIIKGVIDMQMEIDDLRQQNKELRQQRDNAKAACYRLSAAVRDDERNPHVNALIPHMIVLRGTLGIDEIKAAL